MKVKPDIAAERAVLAGLAQFGTTGYVDIADIVDINCFTLESNQIMFKCLKKSLEQSDTVDIASILSSATSLGFDYIANNKSEIEFIRALFQTPIKIENLRKFGAKLRKLEIARRVQDKLQSAYKELGDITGNESIDKILSVAESPIFELSTQIGQQSEDKPKLMFADVKEYLDYLADNPVDQIGISTGFPILDESIGGGLRKGTVHLFAARPKVGKMQPYNSIVYTPSGPTTMGELKVGSIVNTPFGTTATVDAIIEHGVKSIYKVEFNDGTYTYCGLEHLWEVKNRRKNKYQVMSLEEIINSGISESDRDKWQIRLTEPVLFNKRHIDINPYLLGVIIGDGGITTNTIMITSADKEIIDRTNLILNNDYGYSLQHKDRYDYTVITNKEINKLRKNLEDYELMYCGSGEKFIPDEYKYNSVEIRKEILRGLFDTDGCVHRGYAIEYCTISHMLAEDVKEIVQSLGGLCRINKRSTKCNGKIFWSYRLYISFNDISEYFSLNRKKSICTKRIKPNLKRTIRKISSAGKAKCRCIHIDDKNHLYLTDNYIVTHNTTVGKQFCLNIAKRGIPVLMLDSEMAQKDQLNRSIAGEANVKIRDIETGRFGSLPCRDEIYRKALEIKDIPYYYVKITGKPFEEILSIVRRWISQVVGIDNKGNTKDCAIVYDYFKLMDSTVLEHMAEYQAMGFQISKLTDFCNIYQIPCAAFVQVNREGIVKETSDIISQSDRLLWLCGSLSLLRRKTPEEIDEDPEGGNTIIKPLDDRFGGLEPGDHINFRFLRDKSVLIEINTNSQARQNKKTSDGIVSDVGDDDEPIDDSEEGVPFDGP